jgi:hypothetical protein
MIIPDVINETPIALIDIWRGAPRPFDVERWEAATLTGPRVATAWAPDIALTVQPPLPAMPFVLAVGSGIALQALNGVADASARIQLTPAQSNLVPLGDATTFEVTTGAGAARQIVFAGNMNGRGL